jgi:nickel/cobalt transporter (NicO) family protein
MDDGGLASLLVLGFGLGLVHALDGDHVIAVTTLASRRPSLRACLALAGRWALGHGATLLGLGALACLLGVSIPPRFSHFAEWGVAALLFGLGGRILVELLRTRAAERRVHLHFHEHSLAEDSFDAHSSCAPRVPPRHSHWHAHAGEPAHASDSAHRHGHAAIWVGALHGAAGSAPLLAVIPTLEQRSAFFGLAYLLLFCLGVAVAMGIFGGLLGGLSAPFASAGRERGLRWLRGLAAVGSIAFGLELVRGLVWV